VDELLKVEEAQAAVGSKAAVGSDWSNVRRFMDGIVTEDGRGAERPVEIKQNVPAHRRNTAPSTIEDFLLPSCGEA
jgi:hypothetical protein